MSTSALPRDAVAAPKVGRSKRGVDTRPLVWPTIAALLVWMIVPLALTLYFSFRNYNLDDPTVHGLGRDQQLHLSADGPLLHHLDRQHGAAGRRRADHHVVFGTLFAVLFDQEFYGQGISRLFVIAPFFVMPTVAALVWKNLLMDPVNGLFAYMARSIGWSRSPGSPRRRCSRSASSWLGSGCPSRR